MDDFDGFSQLDTLAGNIPYLVTIDVNYVTLANPDTPTSTRTYFKRMLVNAGASYQYLASIRALFYCNFNVESVEIVYGIWDLKPVQWLDWDERVVVNFDIEGVFIVQYVIKPLDYNAWKVIRKLLIELDKQGIQKFPSDLENL